MSLLSNGHFHDFYKIFWHHSKIVYKFSIFAVKLLSSFWKHETLLHACIKCIYNYFCLTLTGQDLSHIHVFYVLNIEMYNLCFRYFVIFVHQWCFCWVNMQKMLYLSFYDISFVLFFQFMYNKTIQKMYGIQKLQTGNPVMLFKCQILNSKLSSTMAESIQ